jgi:prophage antirepressor-like protein
LNKLQIFKNEEFGEVRVIEKEGQVLFVAKDVCECLGLGDTSKALSRLDPDEKGTNSILTLGGNQEMLCVNEYGLFNLVLASRKQSAKQFKRWVTHEVLPSIRKHGIYAIDELINNPDLAIKALTALKEEREKTHQLTHEVEVKNQIIGELKPKADYVDKILKNPGVVTITQIAKDYGMSGKAMNDLLHNKGIQYKQSGQWLLYKDYQDMGYTHSDTVAFERSGGIPGTKLNTKWTQKGRLFIYNILKEDGIVPVIERYAA